MKKNRGFTLVEMMIVVVVIAIISAIAYPSYKDSVRKTNRAEAKTALLEIAQRLERCMTVNGQYTVSAVPPIKTCNVLNGGALAAGYQKSSKAYYDLTISNLTASTFTLTATVASGTPQAADGKCVSFILEHTGRKTATGSDNTNCW